MTTDPITLEVTRHALESIAEDMVFTVLRISQSTVVKLSMDFSTAVCGPDGTLLVQGLSSALHLGAMPDMMRAVLGRFGDDIGVGDVFVTNDPYQGGMHIPDVFVVRAVHDEAGVLLGFAVVVCHHVDMGGRVPGSIAADSTEIHQEGLRIPPIRLVHRGVKQQVVLDILCANVRMPDLVMADLRAQLAACATAARGLTELARRMGTGELLDYCTHLVEYGERLARAEISRWPDGEYRFEDCIDNDGIGDTPLPVVVTLTVAGDGLRVDLAGTADKAAGAINATLPSTKAAVYAAVRYFLPVDVPNNEGFFRVVDIDAPVGSLVNVSMPAACAARGVTMFRVFDTVLGALDLACPGTVFAGSDGGSTGVSFGGTRSDGSRYVFVDFFAGSWGARSGLDGIDGCATPAGNAVNEPVELIEAGVPVRIEEYGYVPDTGGAGQYRGGLAVRRSYRLVDGEAMVHVRSDRSVRAPFGLHGGADGTVSGTTLTQDGETRDMPSKFTRRLVAGDLVVHTLPGGGAVGLAADRRPEAVAADVIAGKTTPAAADRWYGTAWRLVPTPAHPTRKALS
ncbi:hydantoinase B/oxoprolinase family protein [Nakamurella alba]|uniref:hydantoinase B/oxoprolinase family protein n=1 Tax=Nakamurella alba TaxID=2665158 RepID=UPI0018AA658D|nr:hydantoinase B/oxoprolinase family protein [Nakamurella alba]